MRILKNYKKTIYDKLYKEYGELIGGKHLVKMLGYSSSNSFNQAVFLKKTPVKTFPLKDRRGQFASTESVANWLAEVKEKIKD